MELSPTLRAQLDVLQPYLDDEGVSEILVAGPDRVFVTRSGRSQRVELALPDRQIRALADRLLRALGSRADRVELRAGRLGDDLEVAVIGGPRADRCPVIRVQRAATPAGVLLELTAEGGLTAEGERRLADTVHARRAVVVVGPFGAPRARVVLALARSWHVVGRVIALEHEGGSVAQADVADLVLPIDGPVEAALAAAPDVLVTLDPPARLWTGLLTAGRPFVATLEAPDGRTGLERMVALALAGDARLSRSAAEALVLSAAADVVELGPGREAEAAVERGVGRRVVGQLVRAAQIRVEHEGEAAEVGVGHEVDEVGEVAAARAGQGEVVTQVDREVVGRVPATLHAEVGGSLEAEGVVDVGGGHEGDARALGRVERDPQAGVVEGLHQEVERAPRVVEVLRALGDLRSVDRVPLAEVDPEGRGGLVAHEGLLDEAEAELLSLRADDQAVRRGPEAQVRSRREALGLVAEVEAEERQGGAVVHQERAVRRRLGVRALRLPADLVAGVDERREREPLGPRLGRLGLHVERIGRPDAEEGRHGECDEQAL
ncbi:MAG: Flp pilus assembly complex ATPase component TadA [Myxococcales bacterium]|nr:Flp pilus assembly complex ATPase component TadA [Myxococcales bacterium]